MHWFEVAQHVLMFLQVVWQSYVDQFMNWIDLPPKDDE